MLKNLKEEKEGLESKKKTYIYHLNSLNIRMDSYELFKEDIKKAAIEFKKIPKDEVIRVISHLDADGISAASLVIKLLNNDNRKY